MVGRLDKTQPIFEMLEQLELPVDGKLVLPVKKFKRKQWITKSIILKYIRYDNIHVYKVCLFELDYDYTEHKIDTYDEIYYGV